MVRKSKVREEPALMDDRQKRLERITLGLWGVGAVFVVLGMIVLSQFLSRGADAVKGNLFLAFCILGGLFAGGIGVRWWMGRR